MTSKFAEMLKRPLPSSKTNMYTEGAEDVLGLDPLAKEGCGEEGCGEEGTSSELTPEESQQVDERINRIATPILLQDELGTQDEVDMFKESTEPDIMINEGFVTERTIVRFDKNARKSQLKKVAVLSIAKEKKDPLYKKLVTIWKIERKLEAKLTVKYNQQANAKVKQYIARAKKSKSSIVKKAINKITGKK